MVRMSLRRGGDAGPDEVEAGGIRARLEGRDEAMMESPSPSSRTDDGRGDDSLASLESGLGVIGVGDSPRSCAFGIMPAGFSAGQERSTGQWARLPERQTEYRADGNGRIFLLFIPPDPA